MGTLSPGMLSCPRCGTVALPRLAAGPQPGEYRKACCRGCGAYLKWLPKPKESPMITSVNRVVLLGTIGQYGVTVSYSTTGSPCASFMLAVAERGADGTAFTTLIPCQCWGKKAEAASELDANQAVLFEGKIAKRRKGDGWELCVSGFEVLPVGLPALTGAPA